MPSFWKPWLSSSEAAPAPNWTATKPITEWEGVTVDGVSTRVSEIDLSYRRLAGEIPGSLGNLTQLLWLSLRGNRLTGEIPAELSELRGTLQLLDLRDNQLRGEIPRDLLRGSDDPRWEAGFFPWTGLLLSGNQLSGCLPLSLRRDVDGVGYPLHSDFHLLGLRYCQCPAPLPSDPEPVRDPKVGIDGVALWSGRAETAGPHRLSFSLVVDVPEGGNLVAMGPFYDYDRGGVVVMVHEVNSASYLTLDIFSGRERARSVLDGPAHCKGNPSTLFDQLLASAREQPPYTPARADRIWDIDCEVDVVFGPCGEQPLEGGRTYWLLSQSLILDVPEGTRLMPDELFGCSPDGCWVALRLVEEQSGATFSLNRITGSEWGRDIPEGADAETLHALFDAISASVRLAPTPGCDAPAASADCTTLLAAKDILAGDVVLNWGADIPLEDWEGVSVNPRTGRVATLDLEAMGIAGQIPPVLGWLSGLRILVLAGNQLTGEIPRELGTLSGLRIMDLSDNNLAGAIPPELGALTALASLNLDHNNLTGEMPPSLAKHLWVLRLNNNRLTGRIPPEFGSRRYSHLDFSGNRLEGCIPANLTRIGRFGEAESNPELRRCG